MKRPAVLLLVLLALFGCRERREEPQEETMFIQPRKHPYDGGNLLNLAFGASVVSRTAEQTLDTTPVHALDGSPMTQWVSPPGGPRQSAVFSLPAPARIRQVGVLTTAKNVPHEVRFAASMDGVNWRDVATVRCKPTLAAQVVDVPPFDGRYLRVEIADDKAYYASLTSVHASGELLSAPVVPEIEGCWRINGAAASFRRNGARVVGAIGTKTPTVIDGGSDGRVYRLMWKRAAMWGYATITVAPDGKTLSGLLWHEEVNPLHAGEGWFGTRVPWGAAPASGRPPTDRLEAGAAPAAAPSLLQQPGRWSLYGVRFDANDRILAAESKPTLDYTAQLMKSVPSQRWRLIGREFNAGSEERNQVRSAARVAAVRNALRARGIDPHLMDIIAAGDMRASSAVDSTSQRVMESAVELRVLR